MVKDAEALAKIIKNFDSGEGRAGLAGAVGSGAKRVWERSSGKMEYDEIQAREKRLCRCLRGVHVCMCVCVFVNKRWSMHCECVYVCVYVYVCMRLLRREEVYMVNVCCVSTCMCTCACVCRTEMEYDAIHAKARRLCICLRGECFYA